MGEFKDEGIRHSENRRKFLGKFVPKNFQNNQSKAEEIAANHPVNQIDKRTMLKTLGLISLTPLLLGCENKENHTIEAKEIDLEPQEKEILEQITKVVDSFSNLRRDFASRKKIIDDLLAIDPRIISYLDKFSQINDPEIRRYSYTASSFLLRHFTYYEDERAVDVDNLVEIIETGLPDKNPEISALCAQSLISNGYKQGFPAMIDKLDYKYKDIVVLTEPPSNLNQYAYSCLRAFTKQDYGFDSNLWGQWWQKNNNNLSWDQSINKFVIDKE